MSDTTFDLRDEWTRQGHEHENSIIGANAEAAAIERARSKTWATVYGMQKAERDEISAVRDEKVAQVAKGASQKEAIAHVEGKFGLIGEAPDPASEEEQRRLAKEAQAVAKRQAGGSKSSKDGPKSGSSAPGSTSASHSSPKKSKAKVSKAKGKVVSPAAQSASEAKP